MRKNLFILILFLLTSFSSVKSDEWDDFSAVNKAWDAQKTITNQEFEEALEYKQQGIKQKEEKSYKKKLKKISGGGTSLHNELNPFNEISENNVLKKNEDGILLNVPVHLIIDEQQLEKGYYKIIAEKDKNNDVYISFYQSQFFKGKVRATETKDDFDEELIDFAKLAPYNKNFVKVMYGSLDVNAFAYIRYVQENNEFSP